MTTLEFELVVLDMAGTTVIDGGLVEGAFARAWDRVRATETGREQALEHVRATMGQSKIEVFRELGDEESAQAMNVAFETALSELVAEGRCEEVPGAEAAIRELRASGRKIAFTTGFSRVTADGILASLGWRDLADVVLTPVDAGRGRPAPDLNLMALIRTGAGSVASMVTVGDTAFDAMSGCAAGAGLVVGVLTGASNAESLLEAGADIVLASVADLPSVLA